MSAGNGLCTRRLFNRRIWLVALCVAFLGAFWFEPALFASEPTADGAGAAAAGMTHAFRPFALFTDPHYGAFERAALIGVLAVAVGGLCYALLLARQVRRADTGTAKMREISQAVREGADA